MELDRSEFVEAIEELARYHGLEVPVKKAVALPWAKKKQQQQDDYAVMEQVARFCWLRQNGNSKTIDIWKIEG